MQNGDDLERDASGDERASIANRLFHPVSGVFIAVLKPAYGRIETMRTVAGGRLFYIDNLRWTMIFLVVSMHAADTYSPLGSWYYTDRTPLSPPVLLFFAAWQMYLQSFFMGLLFFVAGFFLPPSFDRKGPARFLRDRAFRLGLPVLFYMFVLGPITEYYVAHSWNSTKPTSMANEWIKHIRNGEFLQENGPLWFCLALLIFSAVYVAVPGTKRAWRAPYNAQLIGFALAMAVCTFLIRAPRPPTFLNMHLGDFAQYILLFAAGICATRGRWLPELPFSLGMRWLAVVMPIGFVAWLGLVTRHAPFGGWHWQAAAFSVWESFSCVAICVGLLVLFRQKFNSQGPVSKFLSDNAFSVYVFHPPIVILGARMLHGVMWHPVLKFATLTAIGIIVSFALSAAVFRRIPLLRSIL
jgi:fucose 4-O-acetylase-like acetyltransferase